MYLLTYYSFNPAEMQVWLNREKNYNNIMMWATATTTFLSSAGQGKLLSQKAKLMIHDQIYLMGIYQ